MSADPIVIRELGALVSRQPWWPQKVISGPFVLKGVITDNATTVASLVTSTAFADDYNMVNLLGGGSSNAPKIMLQVEAVEFVLDYSGEFASYSNLNAILRSVYLRLSKQSRQMAFALAPFATDALANQVAYDSTATTLTQRATGARFGPRPLPIPLVVDMSVDTFEVGIMTAVNTTANVPFRLHIHGAAWQSAGQQSADYIQNCVSDDQARKLATTQQQIAALQPLI